MALDPDILCPLSNPLVTVSQLSTSSSGLDNIPAEIEKSMRYAGQRLTQAAGILLKLPQDVIAKAIVTFTRYYVGSEGGSFAVGDLKDVSAAALYMNAKISFEPQSPRSILNVYAYLLSPSSPFTNTQSSTKSMPKPDPESYYLSEGAYLSARTTLLATEALILRTLSFTTHVMLPHSLALTYLQTLSALPSPPTTSSTVLAARTLAYLNSALFSPQLLYLTHHPNVLAVAAIYLAAGEVGVRLTRVDWWEVFDVGREELGFLVVGLGSVEGWVRQEKQKWGEKGCPMTWTEVQRKLQEQSRKEDEGE